MKQTAEPILTEWELFFSYSSYLERPVLDVHEAARRLVGRGLALVAVTSDGYRVSGPEPLREGWVTVVLAGDRPTGALTGVEDEDAVIRRALLEAGSHRYNEIRLFGLDSTLPPSYVRATLAPCALVNLAKKTNQIVHPTVTLYRTGDVLVTLRLFHHGDPPLKLADLINNHLTVPQQIFDLVLVPPRLGQIELTSMLPWRARRKRLAELASVEEELRVPWPTDEPLAKHIPTLPMKTVGGASTSFLAQAIVRATGYEASRRLDNWLTARVLGSRVMAPDAHWFGRPHLHMVRFQGQQQTAKENEERFGDWFGRILLGAAFAPAGLGRKYLPNNLRIMNDYAVYISEGATLWVWGEAGLKQAESAIGAANNPGHLIDEHEVPANLLNLGAIMHRRLYQQARRQGSTEAVLRAQQDVLELEGAMREPSRYGEIRSLLESGWEQMRVPALREALGRLLATQHSLAQIKESQQQARWHTLLTIIFGMLAVPPLSEAVLRPMWQLWQLPRPCSEAAFSLVLVAVASAAVAAILAATSLVMSRTTN